MKIETMIATGIGTLTVLVAIIAIVCMTSDGINKPIEDSRAHKQAELRTELVKYQRAMMSSQKYGYDISASHSVGTPLTQDEISACYIAVGRGNELPRSWRKHYYEGYYSP